MCGIAGIVSSTDRELGPLLEEMLRRLQHRGPDGAGFVIGDSCEHAEDFESLDFSGKRGRFALGHVRLAITGGPEGLQPFRSGDGRLSLLHNGEIYNHRELGQQLADGVDVSTGSDSEVLLRLVEEEYDGDLAGTMGRVLPKLDGVYALAVADGQETIAVRDKIGVRQLYYCTGKQMVAFASEKKPLLALMGASADIHRLPPGHKMVFRDGGYDLERFWNPSQIRPKIRTRKRETALLAYDDAIRDAVEKRVAGRPHIGIIFSGGIDSVLIAHIVAEFGLPFTCYSAGRAGNSEDLRWAETVAERYGFPLQSKGLSVEEIERIIPDVIHSIEDHSQNQVEVAIPIYASVRMAQAAGERVLLTGQGADEIFGGYPWYARIVDREGYDRFLSRSWEDTFLLYKECLEREDKITMAHGIELRVPFLDPEVIRVAFSIAPELKIRPDGDTVLKRIHREYALALGVPEEVAFRPKKAAQHGANIQTALQEIAATRGPDAALLEHVGYDPCKTVPETLGSSSRYGFRYASKDMWNPQPDVQYYLDSEAARLGLLTGAARFHWDETQRRLDAPGKRDLEGGTS